MYRLTLNDGTQLAMTGAGEADGHVWIYGLTVSFAEAAAIFNDAEKTKRMEAFYQESLPVDVFIGYTELINVMRDDVGLKVCLRKE